MKTIYFGASSLDGYIADKNNSLAWLFQFGEPEGDYINAFLREVGAVAMGSTTYNWILDHQVYSNPRQPWPYEVPTFVFSHRRDLRLVEGADIRFVTGNVEPVHAQMKELSQGKNIWIVGGGDLAAQFHDADLLDEIHLQIAPVTLGGGAPVFPRHLRTPLKLLGVRQLDQNFVELVYAVRKTRATE